MGPIEAVFGLTAVAVVGILVAFFWNVERNRQKMEEIERRFQENQQVIHMLRQRVAAVRATSGAEAPTPETVRQSLRTFEQKYLPDPDLGLSRVLGEVNRMARESGVALSSDIMFHSLEEAEYRPGTAARSSGRDFYPGLRLSLTVSGEYPNVKRFLTALEQNPLLLIVESLTLKSVEGGTRPAAASGGSLSLEITLSAYFRRSEGESS